MVIQNTVKQCPSIAGNLITLAVNLLADSDGGSSQDQILCEVHPYHGVKI